MFHPSLKTMSLFMRAISAIIGLIFSYMALFMYHDRRGKLQNRLVDLWAETTARQEQAASIRVLLLRKSSEVAEKGLRWLLGEKLFSLQAAIVSFSLSLSSLGIVWGLASLSPSTSSASPDSSHWYEWYSWPDAARLLIIGVVYLLYAVFAARVFFPKRRWFVALIILVVLTAVSIWFYLALTLAPTFPVEVTYGVEFRAIFVVICVAGLGVTCDIALLSFSRFLIRSVARTTSQIVLTVGTVLNVIWLYVMLNTTLASFRNVTVLADTAEPIQQFFYNVSMSESIPSFVKIPLLLGAGTNLYNFLAASSVFVVLLVALIHRVFWPSVSKVIYALYQWEVFSERKLQLTLAIFFLSLAFPWFKPFLK
jgi:hypothetical protein